MADVNVLGLRYRYPTSAEPALEDVTVQIGTGTWVLLQGATGSGKSTFIKCLSGACPAFYGGHIQGEVRIAGQPLSALTAAQRLEAVGYVAQDPEASTVYAYVAEEVAFALENLGVAAGEMRWRVGEALDLVGLADYARAAISSLSGGQRQRVQIAAALVHRPQVLLLDEPTSQLDPIAADELFDLLGRLNEELGMTIVMSEHRLDKAYARVQRVLYFDAGRVCHDDTPRAMAAWLQANHPVAAPSLSYLRTTETVCLTVREVQQRISQTQPLRARTSSHANAGAQRTATDADIEAARTADANMMSGATGAKAVPDLVPDLALEHLDVQYPNEAVLALEDVSLTLSRQRLTALIGPNGAGKSTLLRFLAGMQPAVRGRWRGSGVTAARARRGAGGVKLQGGIGYIPQNPSDLLSQETVSAELQFALSRQGIASAAAKGRIEAALQTFSLGDLRDRHPRDLSGGERLRVAIASVWVTEPAWMLLDEPTRGLDALQKATLGQWLQNFQGCAVVATHDMEFVAEYAADVVFLVGGQTALQAPPSTVFRQAVAFAPIWTRALRPFDEEVFTFADARRKGWLT